MAEFGRIQHAGEFHSALQGLSQTRVAGGTGHPADATGAPLVVYLRDAASGELDVFSGTSHTVIRDPALVARLTRAVR